MRQGIETNVRHIIRGPAKGKSRQVNPRVNSQSNQPRLQAMFQKYPFFTFRPVNIIQKNIYLSLLAVGYGDEIIEKGTDCVIRSDVVIADEKGAETY